MRQDGLIKALEGIISVEEAFRVTEEQKFKMDYKAYLNQLLDATIKTTHQTSTFQRDIVLL